MIGCEDVRQQIVQQLMDARRDVDQPSAQGT